MTLVPQPIATQVHAMCEAMLALDTDNCPNALFTALVLRGVPDIDAMREAVRVTQHGFPATMSRLQERRVGRKHVLVRVLDPQPPELDFIDLSHTHGVHEMIQALHHHFAPMGHRRRNVFAEISLTPHLVRFAPDLHALVLHAHHVAADGGTMLAMYRTLLAHYTERLTGLRPLWAETHDNASSTARETSKPSTFQVLAAMAAEGVKRLWHPVIKLGSAKGAPTPHRHLTTRSLDEAQTAHVARSAKAAGVTVNDFLCVAAVQAIDALLDFPHGTQSIWVPVNVRGATGQSQVNMTTSINVDLTLTDRRDTHGLARTFATRRKQSLAIGRDVVSLRLLERLVSFAQHWPAAIRQPRMRSIFEQPTTFMISNLGVLWPKREDGKLTLKSAVVDAAGLTVLDFMADFSPFEGVGHEMAAWTFNGRLTIVYSSFEAVMPRDRAEKLMTLVHGFLLKA